jgi:probable addiction module antidote protein
MAKKRKRRVPPSRPYTAEFEQRQNDLLRDPSRAAKYLMHALNHGDETDLRLALADVVRARSVTGVAAAAGIHRTTLHRMLNPANKPTFSSMVKVLEACDLKLLVAAAGSQK